MRLLILSLLLVGGAGAGFVLNNILHYVYKLVIKNIDDLNSLYRNNEILLGIGCLGCLGGLLAYMVQIFSLDICDMMVVKNAKFNSLWQKICLIIVRFLGIVPMASYLILCLLKVYSRVIKNADGFNRLCNKFKINEITASFGVGCSLSLIFAHKRLLPDYK
jgi:hypothetical protein